LDAYDATLQKLANQKITALKSEKNIFIKKRKLQDFLMQKGFETDYIRPLLQNL
jgi:regulatory protein